MADEAAHEEPASTPGAVPAGWYPDPDPEGAAAGRSRYFDGERWSAFTRDITEVIESVRASGEASAHEAAHERVLGELGRRQLADEPVELDPDAATPLPAHGMTSAAGKPRKRGWRTLVLATCTLVLLGAGGVIGYEQAAGAELRTSLSR